MVVIEYVLGNKLPTKYDAIIDLFKGCSRPTSSKMASQVSSYSLALIWQWVMAFGTVFITDLRTVKDKID